MTVRINHQNRHSPLLCKQLKYKKSGKNRTIQI